MAILNKYWMLLYIITVVYIPALGFVQVVGLNMPGAWCTQHNGIVFIEVLSVITMSTVEAEDVREDLTASQPQKMFLKLLFYYI